MSTTVFVSPWDAGLLLAFLAGDPNARDLLPRRLQAPLLKLAKRIAPDLAPDLCEEIVQRTWELLLQKSPLAFDPARGSPRKYLSYLLRTAATDVRASYTPPGQRTRPYKNPEGELIRQEQALSLDASIDGSEADVAGSLADRIPDPADPIERLHQRMEAEWYLVLARGTADDFVFQAMLLVYLQGACLGQAATAVGVHRSTLRRQFARWVTAHELAMAA